MRPENKKKERERLSEYWRPRAEGGSRVRVFDDEKVRELLDEGLSARKKKGPQRCQKAPGPSAAERQEADRLRRYERKREEMRRKREDQDRQVKEKIVENQIKRDKKFDERRRDIAAGHSLADDIQGYLSLQELNKRTKLKRQFDDWNTEVYGAIQEQINEKIEGMSDEEVNRKRRGAFQEYLDLSNAKAGYVFRDIIIESEYDPLEANRRSISFLSEHIKDPLKRVLDKHHEERTMLEHGDDAKQNAKRPGPALRDMLDATSWGTGNIEATPHGYFAKLMDDDHNHNNNNKNNTPQQKSKTYDSQVPFVFCDFNIPKGFDVTQREFPVGKKGIYRPSNIQSLG